MKKYCALPKITTMNHTQNSFQQLAKPVKISKDVNPGISGGLIFIGLIAVIPVLFTIIYYIVNLFTS